MERNRVPAVIGRNCLMLISALEHGDGIAFLERDDRLLPPCGGTAGPAAGDFMASHLHGPDVGDGHSEQFLQGVPDVILVRLGVDLEGVFLPVLIRRGALLGHHGAYHDLVQRRHYLDPFFFGAAFFAGFEALFFALVFFAAFALAAGLALVAFFLGAAALVFPLVAALSDLPVLWSRSALSASDSSGSGSGMTPLSAPSSTTPASDQRMSYADASGYAMTSTFGRFLPLRYAFALWSAVSTSTRWAARSRLRSSSTSCAVRGARKASRSMTCIAPSRARAFKALFRASCRTFRGISVR